MIIQIFFQGSSFTIFVSAFYPFKTALRFMFLKKKQEQSNIFLRYVHDIRIPTLPHYLSMASQDCNMIMNKFCFLTGKKYVNWHGAKHTVKLSSLN